MVRKCTNPTSGDLGINVQGVPWEFMFLIGILGTAGFTPSLYIPKFLVLNNLEG